MAQCGLRAAPIGVSTVFLIDCSHDSTARQNLHRPKSLLRPTLHQRHPHLGIAHPRFPGQRRDRGADFGCLSAIAAGGHPARHLPMRQCPDDPMTVSRLKVRDGTQLAYELRGRVGDAPPVVLIHSLGMDRTFWNAVTPALAHATAVLLYDCRGHGQSDKPKGPYRVEQFANDLADLMDGVGWRR